MSNERKTPLLCLKTGVASALHNGQKIKLQNPPRIIDGITMIPKEALALVGISCDEEYIALEKVEGIAKIYEDMGLIFFDRDENYPSLDTEKDLHYILSLAHAFIFEIEVGPLGNQYLPATDSEREGFMKVGKTLLDTLLKRNNTHPFVFGSQKIFDDLRKIYTSGENNEEYKHIAKLIEMADGYIKKYPALNEDGTGILGEMPASGYGEDEYDEGGRHSDSEGKLLEITHLAFAYQMTHEERYARLAYFYALGIIKRKHWGPGHFLNCSGATTRLVMIYDWLYSAWRELKLDTGLIKRGIYTHGLLQGFNAVVLDTCEFPSPKQGTGWRFKLKPDNWNSVCNSGMIVGTLCLLSEGADDVVSSEEYDHLTELLGACITSTMQPSLVFTQYAPDGSYEESNSYWAYGTTNLVTSMAALYDSLGTNLGLHNACGFDKTCYYAINSESADFVGWNYHDGGLYSQNTSCFNPLAVMSGNTELFALRKNQIEMGKDITILDMLYHPSVRGYKTPELSALSLDYAMEGIDAFTVRSGWEKGSLFAGIIGGANPTGGSHAQLDSGSFVYHNLGKMWFCDLGPDNYNSHGIENGLGYFGNYALYKRNAEGNNVLALKSMTYGQRLGGRGVMTEYKSSNSASYAIIDNTTIYDDKTEYARRGMLLTNDRKTLVIKDEVAFVGNETAFTTAHFESDKIIAEISNNGKKCTLTHKDGQRIYVSILGDGALEVMDCVGILDGTAPAEGENSRDNFKRLVINYENAKAINTSFVIDTSEDSTFKENISMEMWKTL